MGILSWLVVGAIAGWVASKLVGGWLAGTLFHDPNAISGFNLTTIVIAILGAVVVLFVVRLIKR